MSKSVTIIDYGMCNLHNVTRAFEHSGAQVTVTDSPILVSQADRLVVPGVGAFRDSLHEVNARGFGDALRSFAQSGRPMFGICVGLQLLFDASEEFGEHPGLGILSGRVRAIQNTTVAGDPQRVPHIGWNHLVEPEGGRTWRGTLLDPVNGLNPAVYFVHSYAAEPSEIADRLADCMYGGHRVCAAVQRENIMGTQFHPERSGPVGLELVQYFTRM